MDSVEGGQFVFFHGKRGIRPEGSPTAFFLLGVNSMAVQGSVVMGKDGSHTPRDVFVVVFVRDWGLLVEGSTNVTPVLSPLVEFPFSGISRSGSPPFKHNMTMSSSTKSESSSSPSSMSSGEGIAADFGKRIFSKQPNRKVDA